MSGFRLICIAALTALTPAAAAAQTATAGDKPGNAYLAGLRPPHDQHKPAHLKTIQKTNRLAELTPAAKTTPLATQRQVAVASKTKVHRPARLAQKSLAEKINARVAWPNLQPGVEPGIEPGVQPGVESSLGPRVEPTAAGPTADERTAPDTALQFTTEGTNSVTTAAPRSTMAASPAATKPAPPPTIAATNERKVDPAVVDTTPTATTPVQTEPFDAPPPSQMRVIMPAPNSDPNAAPAPSDPPPPSSSSTAQMLATVAGAIAAGIVAWLMMGSRRIARSKEL